MFYRSSHGIFQSIEVKPLLYKFFWIESYIKKVVSTDYIIKIEINKKFTWRGFIWDI